jgi:hypothetical protein
MSAKENIKKKLSKGFSKAKAFDQRLGEGKAGRALDKFNDAFDKAVGRVIRPHNRAANLTVDAGLFAGMGVIAGLTAASGGILLPVIAGVGAAAALANTAVDVNDWRKSRKAKKNLPKDGF